MMQEVGLLPWGLLAPPDQPLNAIERPNVEPHASLRQFPPNRYLPGDGEQVDMMC